jgi:hypothetical protein
MLRSLLALPLALIFAGCSATAADAPSELATSQDEALTSLARPTKLADLAGGAYGPIRLSATHVYFFDHDLRSIRRVPKVGGAVETVLASNGSVRDFVLDATHVYAVIDRSGADSWNFGEIARAPLAGGAVETQLGGELSNARIAVDAADVYVATDGTLARFPKNGAFFAPEILDSPRNVSAITVDAANVYWADMGPGNPAIGCNMGDGKIVAKSKRGGPARIVADAQDCPVSIAVDGSSIWYRSFFGPLTKVPTMGGPPSTIAATTVTEPSFDATSVFFAVPSGSGSLLQSERKNAPLQQTFAGTHTSRPSAITAVAADRGMFAFYVVSNFDLGTSEIQRVVK